MLPTKLSKLYQETAQKYPHVTEENMCRILLLFHGLDYKKQHSFPDHFMHYELIFSVNRLSTFPVLTLLNPNSPFKLIDTEEPQKHALLYENQFVDFVYDFEQRAFDFKKPEPFYFYVTEVNGDLVLKLNPVQLCDFFQNTKGQLPCSFCFRNDMVQRFKNITAQELVAKIIVEETKRDNLKTLKNIDEISIVTGSYKKDGEYVKEVSALVSGLKPYVKKDLRVVVGSHEGKSKKTFQDLKKAGVTVFAFPVESLDDHIRKSEMKNRKGDISVDEVQEAIANGIAVFGAKGVIIRLVAGMGDVLNQTFVGHIEKILSYSTETPVFNINQYMPFTHFHFKLFEKNRPFDIDYMLKFTDIVNRYIPVESQLKFKVSP